jgi:hypothetical protein
VAVLNGAVLEIIGLEHAHVMGYIAVLYTLHYGEVTMQYLLSIGRDVASFLCRRPYTKFGWRRVEHKDTTTKHSRIKTCTRYGMRYGYHGAEATFFTHW